MDRELMKKYQSLPKDMRVTDNLYWNSSAAIYGVDFLHTFCEATVTVEQLQEMVNEKTDKNAVAEIEVSVSLVAELMLEEIYNQWQRIEGLPSELICSKEEWKKSGGNDENFKKAFENAPYHSSTLAELKNKTHIKGVLDLLIWKADRYY